MELWLNALFSWPKNIQCFDSWRPDSLGKKQLVDLFRVFQYTYNTFTSIYLGSFEEIQPTLPSYEYKLLGIFVVSDLSQWSGIRLDIALLWLGLVLILVHSHMHSRRFTNMVKTPLRFYTAKSYDSIPLASSLLCDLQLFRAVFVLPFIFMQEKWHSGNWKGQPKVLYPQCNCFPWQDQDYAVCKKCASENRSRKVSRIKVQSRLVGMRTNSAKVFLEGFDGFFFSEW